MKDTETNQSPSRERIWTLLCDMKNEIYRSSIEALTRELGITPLTARLLCNRGYTTPETAELFLRNDERVWHDPLLMVDMEPAVVRVLEAVDNREKIAIYGDYDVDGVTSVTSLYLYLTGLGADVTCYIPNRLGEGYGMSVGAVNQLADMGVTLIITVDTGITAHAEIAHAAALGVDTVVTDHHECHAEIPLCTAVVNPHRPDCPYPFKELAGVGVVFKFICACETIRTSCTPAEALSRISARMIDLVAIGTIADVMPLTDENRFIVSRGLSMLDHTERPGLAALLDAISGSGNSRPVSGSSKKPRRKVNSGLVGFGIAPRINAAGRIAHAMKAVDLLLADTAERAEALAEELCEINAHRQAEENRIAEQAYAMIDAQLADAAARCVPPPSVIVLEEDGWMQGIVGIVASRITEKYGLPSILISFEGAITDEPSPLDVGKGSGRSVKGLNLVDALADSRDLLVRFGGHELAAGLTVRRADIPAFRERINAYAAERLTEDMTAVRFEADCEAEMAELTMDLAEELEGLEPFGVGNQTPLFILRDAVVQKIIPLGAGKHTKLMIYRDGTILQAIWFSHSTARLPFVVGDTVDILFQLNINDYQGVRSLQLIVQDMRMSETFAEACRREETRLAEVLDGAPIDPEEHLVPTREDIASVFTVLRSDARIGNRTVSERNLLDRANRGVSLSLPMNTIKLRLIMRILDEMGVCHVEDPIDGVYIFEVNFASPKTTIDASPLMQSLRRQQVAGEM
ncbi:MAG: single-stranded-DNA-specific exonuclease RecJ [Clostridia bacterium]|nr:single-stranded-DNA-specific exonuclease RecJ [Clostridia bacterium]